MENKKYVANGIVLGNYWGGGKGYYKAETIAGNSIKEVETLINEKITNGSLDSGMGYESLCGAIMDIQTIETIEHKGKTYTNIERETRYYGEIEFQDFEEEEDTLKFMYQTI